MQPIKIHIANSSGSLDPYLEIINVVFTRAAAHAAELINAEGVDVVIVDAPDETIPEWGVGGYTWSAYTVLVALDSVAGFAADKLETTLLHEFHHTMRWRGPGCSGSLAQLLVSEGLAVLFEEEVLGEAPFYSRVPITDQEIQQARAALFDEKFSPAKWFYGAEGVTRAFGYTYGYRLCREYAELVGRSASELVSIPTREVLAAVEVIGV